MDCCCVSFCLPLSVLQLMIYKGNYASYEKQSEKCVKFNWNSGQNFGKNLMVKLPFKKHNKVGIIISVSITGSA